MDEFHSKIYSKALLVASKAEEESNCNLILRDLIYYAKTSLANTRWKI